MQPRHPPQPAAPQVVPVVLRSGVPEQLVAVGANHNEPVGVGRQPLEPVEDDPLLIKHSHSDQEGPEPRPVVGAR